MNSDFIFISNIYEGWKFQSACVALWRSNKSLWELPESGYMIWETGLIKKYQTEAFL